jgi:hypothetical protein
VALSLRLVAFFALFVLFVLFVFSRPGLDFPLKLERGEGEERTLVSRKY